MQWNAPSPIIPKPGKIFFASKTPNCVSLFISLRLRGTLSADTIFVDLVDPEDYDPDNLPTESLVVIVASTSKDRRPSANLQVLVRWLRRSAETLDRSTPLKGCKFVVLGVQSQGHDYGVTSLGRHLVRWMRSLGASQILPLWVASGDSAEFDNMFDSWCRKLVDSCKGQFKDDAGGSSLDDNVGEEYKDHVMGDEIEKYGSGVELEEADSEEFDEEESRESQEADISDHLEKVSKKMRVMPQGSVFYVLLEHIMHEENAVHMLIEPEGISVVSLYRVEITGKGDGNTIKSLGSPVFNFPSDQYPVGMGYGALGSKIIFVGGHVHDQESDTTISSKRIYILDISYINNANTNCALDIARRSDCGRGNLLEIKESPQLNKSNPVVVSTQGKLFVLPNNFSRENCMNPTIDSYDIQKDKWKSFDIFEIYEGCGSLSTHPQVSEYYIVQACCVMDSTIFIYLCHETYAFDVNKGKLYLVGPPGSHYRTPPFDGMGVYAEGCFFGVEQLDMLYAYKHNPFKQKFYRHGFVSIHPDFYHSLSSLVGMKGMTSHVGLVGETNRLVVARSAHGRACKGLYLVFDFFSIGKEANDTMTCEIEYAIVVHNCHTYSGHVKACFPMDEFSTE